MWTKDSTCHRVALFVVIASLTLVVSLQSLALGQHECHDCSDCGTGDCCPPPQPVLEMYPGWTLYWHDSCQDGAGDWWRYCQPIRHPSTSPVWYGSADFLPLFRDRANEIPFQTLGPDGDVVLSTSSFDAEFQGGIRATIGRSLGHWYRLEGSWMGSYGWSDLAAVRNLDEYDLDGDGNPDAGTSGNLYSPFSGFGTPGVNPTGVVGLDFNRFASIRFSSDMNSAEINLRRRLCLPHRGHCETEASVLIGLRYMSIDEDFNYLTASNIPAILGSVNNVDVHTTNDLFGPQLGFLAQFLIEDRGWIDFEIKGALFANHAQQRTLYQFTNNVGVTTPYPSQADVNETALLGEVSLVLNYQIAPAWTFRIGYNATAVTGVALGADNFNADVNILKLGPATVEHSGEIVYHGPSIGLVWAR